MQHKAVKRTPDCGPIYKETDMSRMPVEPVNTVSNLIFLFIFIWWAWKTKLNFKKFPLLTFAMPLLLIGWIGGTIYHATRSHYIWLLIDYIPILILVLTAAVYLWKMLVKNWVLVFLLALGPACIYRILFEMIHVHHTVYISVGYSILAANVVVPAVLHCALKYRRGWKALTAALLCFVIAIVCRQLDYNGIENPLPMGTHFLWHIFGGLSAFFLAHYIYHVEKNNYAVSES
jgi:hemolysin III